MTSTFFHLSAKEDIESSERFIRLANQLRCPTCQGLSVKDSDAGFSNIIKGKIINLINKGESDEEIKKFFVKRYGEWILRTPRKEGFNLLLWLVPSFLIISGLFWVFFRFKILGIQTNKEKLKELTPEEEKKIIEDLNDFKRE